MPNASGPLTQEAQEQAHRDIAGKNHSLPSIATMNITTQRPGTAQSLSLGPRMPFEAAEALLWERQNNRVNIHLSAQMKELQEQHDRFSARIQATEAVAEAAEASLHKIKQMDAKITAIEAEEHDRPLDAWTKESIKELQISVDAMKGVRQKLSGLENKIDEIGEQVETARGESAVLKDVVKRLGTLEEERQDEARKVASLEKEVNDLRAGNRYQELAVDRHVERAQTEVREDDSPLAVFYGIEKQSPPARRQSPIRGLQSPVRNERSPTRHRRSSMRREIQAQDGRSTYNQESPRKRDTESSRWSRLNSNSLQPPDEEPLPGEEDDFHILETQPEVISMWENTQLYKNMEREMLQRSPSSDAHLFSSPPKRSETRSARRNLMKRHSVRDSRVPLNGQQRQIEPAVIDAHGDLGRVSTKRKYIDDAPIQRTARPKLSVETATDEDIVTTADRKKASLESSLLRSDPPFIDHDTPALSSPARRTYGKQKPTEVRAAQYEAPQASPGVQNTVSSPSKPLVPATKAMKAGKLIGKLKSTAKGSAQANTNSSKQSTVKKEVKEPRKPPGACMSCRSRHAACDRTRPVCGRCTKSGATCEYPAVARAAKSHVVKLAVSPMKEGKLKKDQATPKDEMRERSVIPSPELFGQVNSARCPKAARSVKQSATAASFREPRIRSTQQSEQKSPRK
ncbi:hypothetical protein E8E13_006973 [Curvularia kusanoi]|uniref:Zn(2)-C6 fungal-type domain-containing protein n=1 Tax=Curvularia kusanoi TaxID=90978 RepID=A0A9P4WAY0_CURKU|nr:hypothetical protein E8E13_006973 [Curvularia kusanoi]